MKQTTAPWVLGFVLLLACAASAQAVCVLEAAKAAVKTEGGPEATGGWNLWSNGRVGQPLRFAAAGTYRVTVRAWGSPAGGGWPEMALAVDGTQVRIATVNKPEPADYPFEIELAAGFHEIAAAFLNDAVAGREDRNLHLVSISIAPPPGVADPVPADARELAAEAARREGEIVAATGAAIERNRKADATLRVTDAGGRPVAGARVTATQTGQEFLFGCNIFGFDHCGDAARDAAYKQRFEGLFNYATVGFYWRWYESERGRPNYAYTDQVVAWCVEHGIRLKGHPLLWGNEAGVPPWSKGQPAPELQRARVQEIMTRYRGKIGNWEVVNEPSHEAQPKIDEPYRWARAADPAAHLIVNDYYVFADGAPGFLKLLTEAQRAGVPFDGIGIQAHEPRTRRFPLERVQAILDRYAALGKTLQITEYEPTSGGAPIEGSHLAGVWDEAAQADYAEKFYRVCFAHPAMRAITWWDLSDRGSWLPGGGLVRADMSPKPVYARLRKLIREDWSTRFEGATGADGRCAFRGFRGAYRVTVAAGGAKAEQDFELTKDGPREIVVRLAAAPARP